MMTIPKTHRQIMQRLGRGSRLYRVTGPRGVHARCGWHMIPVCTLNAMLKAKRIAEGATSSVLGTITTHYHLT